MTKSTPAVWGALLALALAPSLSAQTDIDLRQLAPGRGAVALGQGGLVGQPPLSAPFTPVAGALGAASCWIDLDGDGFDDLVVGAPDLPLFPASGASDTSGHVYVLFGGPGASLPANSGDLDLEDAVCGTVLNLVGGQGDRFGTSVANAGDVDGDGFDDLLIGAPDRGPNFTGAAYLLYGAADLPTLPGTQPAECQTSLVSELGMRSTRITGLSSFAQLGTSVAGADVNGDGRGDVVMGAPLGSSLGKLQNGYAAVLYGTPSLKGTVSLPLSSLGPGDGVVVAGADDFMLLGWSVAGVGNFDPALPGGGEDLALGEDVLIGAPGAGGTAGLFCGAVHLLRGVTSGSHPVFLTSAAFDDTPGGAGLTWSGEASGDQLGLSVAAGGDLIDVGDGFPEVLLSAPLHDGLGRVDGGAVYVIAGRRGSTNPTGFPLVEIGAGGLAVEGLRIVGPVAQGAREGFSSAPAGDLDGDGFNDLALGLPGATVTQTAPSLELAGQVSIIAGGVLAAPLDRTIDLATIGSNRIFRLRGETAGALAGTSLALGDHDGDGFADLAVGAPGAPSDPDPLDFSGQAYRETGRGHVLFGPLVRIGGVTPPSSFKDGPTVELEVFNLTDPGLASVRVDGVPATIVETVLGTPGRIVFEPPAPLVPGAGASVPVTVETGGLTVDLFDAFTYEPFEVIEGPDLVELVPGVEVSFTCAALSSAVTVKIGGKNAVVVNANPETGSLIVVAPSGEPSFTPLDVDIETENGSQVLMGAVSYLPFITGGLTPDSGSQESGIFFPTGGFTGTPTQQLTIQVNSSDGIVPPDITFELGTDELGFIDVPVASIVGDLVTLDLPDNLLGPSDVLVDLRVTSPGLAFNTLVEDAFTWEKSDFTLRPGTASGGFGDAPSFRLSGDFVPSGDLLIRFDDYDSGPVTFAFMFIGIDLIDPPVPLKGGLLGVSTEFLVDFSVVLGNVPAPFGLDTVLANDLNPPGFSLYLQLVTQEQVGMATAFGFSERMQVTIRED